MIIQKNEDIMAFDIVESSDKRKHIERDIIILYLLEGKGTLSIGRSRFELQQEDIVAVNSMKEYSYRLEEHTLIGILHVDYFRLLGYFDPDEYYFRCNSVIDKNKGYQEMRDILNKIFRLYFEREKEKVYLNSLYYELLRVLIVNFSCRKEWDERENLSSDEKRTREIVRYLRTYYQYPVSLNDMAEHLHLNSSYLSKYIKKNLGTNFMSYLNQIRLENAMEELENSEKSITQIALDNGFPNTAAFSNSFRKEYGDLPSAWQKSRKKNPADEQSIRFAAQKENTIHQFLEKRPSIQTISERGKKVLVSCDTEKSRYYPKNWNRMINVGAVSGLLHSDLQEHLKILHQELGVTYVRFWDIFSDDMLMNYQKADGVFNFKRMNMALDFLVNNGMHPFIELGLKPVRLLTRTIDRNVMIQEREPASLYSAEYADALRTFLTHCVNRYGMREVEQWYFEQWGDPRVTQGEEYGTYFQIFEQAYHIVKAISPNIRIGGAGFGRLYSTLEFQDIMNLWKKRICYPDFISMYAYPYMARNGLGSQNNDRIQDPDFIRNQVMMMREVLDRASMHIPELILTEWSSSISDWNCLNDSMYKGAFMLKSLIDNIGLVDMMGYWLASDILTEYFDTGTLLHGGNGLLSTDGIKKPAFYAIQFAGKIYENILMKTEQTIVTANGHGDYYIACHNYVSPNFKYYLKQEDEVDVRKQFLLFDDAKPLKLHFQIRHVKKGRYVVKVHSLSEKKGSVQDAWGEMNFSENLSQRDIQYLKGVSAPKISMTEYTAESGTLEIDTVLEPQEIQNIHIIYQIE